MSFRLGSFIQASTEQTYLDAELDASVLPDELAHRGSDQNGRDAQAHAPNVRHMRWRSIAFAAGRCTAALNVPNDATAFGIDRCARATVKIEHRSSFNASLAEHPHMDSVKMFLG